MKVYLQSFRKPLAMFNYGTKFFSSLMFIFRFNFIMEKRHETWIRCLQVFNHGANVKNLIGRWNTTTMKYV